MTDTPPRVRDLRCAPLDRMCIIMMSAAGDAVHVLPVVNALKRARPRCHISWVLQPGPASLVRGHAAVDEVILFERGRGWRAFRDVRRTLAGRRFDVVLALQTYLKAGIVTSLTRSPIKLGFDRERARDFNWLFTTHRVPARPPQHIQDQYLEFLTALGVPHEPVEWGLGPWPHERAWQQEFFSGLDRPAAALVIGSSKPDKDWMPDRWAAVADLLVENYSLQPVLVGGRSVREIQVERVIMQHARQRVISALGSGFRRLVGILDGSALVISLDTGPLHMAVALGRPVISLIGYTNPRRTGPYRHFQDLVIDAYGEPGESYAASLKTRQGRMSRIGVDDVADRIALWAARYRDRDTSRL